MRAIFLTFSLIISLRADPPPPIVNLESPPETLVGGCVSVISGEFVDAPVDLFVPAVEPLLFQRLYIRPDCDWSTLWNGWEHNFMRGLCAFHKHQLIGSGSRYKEVLFRDEIGSAVHLRGDTNESKTLHFKISKDATGVTNVGRGVICGRTNLQNMEITFAKDLKSAILMTGGGIKRYFLKRHFDGQSRTYYNEQYEERPSGYRFSYSHEGDFEKDILHVRLTTANLAKEAGWLKIETPIDPFNECQSVVTASNGAKVCATFTPKEGAFLISAVQRTSGPPISYSYNDRSLRLFEKRLPEGRFVQIHYYEKGKYETEAGPLNIKSGHWQHGRVKEIIQPAGAQGEEVATHRFVYQRAKGDERDSLYDDKTRVYDAQNHLTTFAYNDEDRIKKIVHYKGCEAGQYERVATDKFVWGDRTAHEQILLKSRMAIDHEQLTSWKEKSYHYDTRGNVLIETTLGNYTGNAPSPYREAKNPPEQHQIRRTYTENLNLIETETHPNGLQFCYTYLPETDLVETRLTFDQGHLSHQIKNRYDEENHLVETIEEEGCLQKITRYSPKKEAPCLGFPEEVSDYAVENGSVLLLSRKVNTYNSQGKLTSQQFFGSDDQLAYQLQWDYDDYGNCILETTKDGAIIRRQFDANSNCLEEIGPHPDHLKRYRYDAMNRLVMEEEIIPGHIWQTFHTYDEMGNRLSTKNPFHETTTYSYDDLHRLTQTTYPAVEDEEGQLICPVAKQQLDIFGRTIVKEDAKGNRVVTYYTAHDKPYEITYPDGTKEQFRYDMEGNLTLHISKSGAKTLFQRDTFGREIKRETFDDEGTLLTSTSNVYEGPLLKEQIDPLGFVTRFEYDPFGRKIAEIFGERKRVFSYDALGHIEKTENYEGDKKLSTHIQEYDVSDRLLREVIEDDEVQVETSYRYDIYGNCILQKKGEAIWTYEYDALGRQIKESDPFGHTTQILYDETYQNHLGQTVLKKTVIDAQGNWEVTVHDTLGRESFFQKLSPFGVSLYERSTVYDSCGQPCRITENNQITSITYDPLNRPKGWVRALGTDEERRCQTTYNELGQRKCYIKGDGTRLNYSYDPLGRLTALSSSDGSVSYRYRYNERSELILVEDLIKNQHELRSYTPEGYLEEERLQNGLSFRYSYDALGRTKQVTLPDDSRIIYHSISSIERVDREGKSLWTHRYDSFSAQGRPLQATLLNDAGTINYSYDSIGRPTAISHPLWSQTDISYDSLGRLTSYIGQEEPHRFTYDALHQLTFEEGNQTHIYAYDPNQNRIEKDGLCYSHNALNELKSDGQSYYSYDLCGNLTKITSPNQTLKLSYDALDRLIAVEVNEQTTHYSYDSHHRRLTSQNSQTTHFLYIDQNEVGALQDNQITQLRVLGIGLGAEIGAAIAIELDNIPYAPLHDHNGNLTALISSDGQLLETLHYSAFGESTTSTHSPWTFSSKRHDLETNLIFFGRRYYSPHLGRFITPDPDYSSLHPYHYTNNNPLTNLDLYGLEPQNYFDSPTLDFLYNSTTALLYCTGWAIDNIGFHFVPFPIFRDILHSIGSLLMGRGLVWEPHYPSAVAETEVIHGDISRDKSEIDVGGMLTEKDDSTKSAKRLKRDNTCVVDFYSPSHGFVGDLISTVLNWLQFDTSSSRLLRSQIRDCLAANPNQTVTVHAHSRGGAVLENALSKMTPEERGKIRIYTYGSAALIHPSLAKEVVNFVASNDPIPTLCNPIRFLRVFFGEQYNIIKIRSTVNPYTAHGIEERPYLTARAMAIMGKIDWVPP